MNHRWDPRFKEFLTELFFPFLWYVTMIAIGVIILATMQGK